MLWSVVLIVALIVGIFSMFIFLNMDDHQPQATENEGNKETESVAAFDIDHITKSSMDPFTQSSKQAEMTDTDFRNYIHKMSHQKVVAEDKWGFFEITTERIAWLLSALETDDVKRRLTDGDVYADILTRWYDGNFSQVDQDHNIIWQLQGGTVGKATGILNDAEEAAYIKSVSESN